MSTEENQRICDALFPLAWNEGDFSLVDEHVSPDVVDHFDHSQGIDAFKGVIGMFRGAFPDLRLTIEDSLADGDKVVHRWSMTGTNEGSLMGIPPTGRAMTWTGTTIVRLEDGKIVERWANVDVLGILQQMGVVPPPPGAP
ncbi:MAG: hypothetical protein QOI56_1887 [Actinomycetota bacterium]|jgi:predicted ester cyclase|nr:hypothetical protein [Actinomycetota bacterium]